MQEKHLWWISPLAHPARCHDDTSPFVLTPLRFYDHTVPVWYIPWTRCPNPNSSEMAFLEYAQDTTLQRLNTENSKQIVPEKELRGLSPNFHIHVSLWVISYIPRRIGPPILLQENK